MKIQYVVLGIVLAVIIILGLVAFAGKKTHAPANTTKSGSGSESAETVHTLPDLNVTYQLDPDLQELYNIQVTSQTKASGASNDLVFVSGKACNNMRGSFVIIDAGEQTDKKVIKTLQDGRQVLEAAIASTMMACPDTSNPKLDDAALTNALNAIGTSIASTSTQ